jgi:hypothetical protein
MRAGLAIPAVSSHMSEEAISFAIEVVDASGVPERLEALLVRRTGRPRSLPVRALLVALLCLAIDDRALHLSAATTLLYRTLSAPRRAELGVRGDALTKKSLLARYRCVRYLFHLMVGVMDPSLRVKNRVIDQAALDALALKLNEAEVTVRRERLESVVGDLIQASIQVCTPAELETFDGSAGLDATVVPLFSRGTCAARCSRLRPRGPSGRSPCSTHRRIRPRSAPRAPSPSPLTWALDTIRTSPSDQRTGLGSMPPIATPSRAPTAS